MALVCPKEQLDAIVEENSLGVKMNEEKKFTPRKPDFKGTLDVSTWVHQGEDGRPILKIKLGTSATPFKNEPKVPELL